MHQQYFVPFVAVWAVLGIGGTVALALLRDPAIKRVVQLGLVAFSGAVFVAFVWLVSGSVRSLAFSGVAVSLVILGNVYLVRVCYSCAALVQPRYLVPPKFCSKCGAPLR